MTVLDADLDVWHCSRVRKPLTSVVVAEFVGTALLVMGVVGSGIMATRETADGGVALLANSVATGAVLVALILALRAISASFNPVLTVLDAVIGRITIDVAAASVAAQVVGGVVGAVLANLMFDLSAISIAGNARGELGTAIGEVVATAGLVVVVNGALRDGRTEVLALGVAGWITAAYWFTSSTSFANPAVTLARTLSDTYTGIDPASALLFLAMQAVGGALGLLLVRVLHPFQEPA